MNQAAPAFDPKAQAYPESGAVLLPTQAAFVTDPEPFLVLEKGRRTGGTWGIAYGAAERVIATREAGGMNVYYIPQTFEDSIEFIETCGRWLRALDVVAGAIEESNWGAVVEADLGVSQVWGDQDPDRNIKTYSIRVPATGLRIVALSSQPARIRGKQGLIIFDEAGFHKAFREVLKSAMAMFLRGGKIWVLSTHNGDTSAFNEVIGEIRSGSRKGKVYTYPFQRAVAEGMYKRICEMDGKPWSAEAEAKWMADAYAYYGEDASEELDAIPKSGSGGYLPGAMIDRAMVEAPVIRWSFDEAFNLMLEPDRRAAIATRIALELDPLLDDLSTRGKAAGTESGLGMDYARTGDLTTIAPGLLTQALRKVVPFILELRNCPEQQQRQILWHIIRRLPRWKGAALDATGNGETTAELTYDEFGALIERIKLNDSVYAAMMPPLKTAFEDQTLDVPRDKDVRRDLRQVQKINGVAKIGGERYKGADGEYRHGDTAVALMLLNYILDLDTMDMAGIATAAPRPSLGGYTIGGYPAETDITGTGWGTVPGSGWSAW